MSNRSIDEVRSRMSNTIARCYFSHHHDQDAEGRPACYFSGTVESGEFGFWVHVDGRVVADETVGGGTLPSKRIVDPCVRAAKTHLSCS